MSTQNIIYSTLRYTVYDDDLVARVQYAINRCLLACSKHSGSGVLSSDGGERVKLYAGKTRRDWGS